MTVEPWYDRYIPEPMSGCWLWLGMMYQDGYGACYVPELKTTKPAHRKFYERHHGPIPEGMSALHRCDNRLCVNPDHIFLGTQADNMADKVKNGRCQDQRGENGPGAKLSAAQVAKIRSSTKRQAVLAREFGVHQSQISKIKAGKIY